MERRPYPRLMVLFALCAAIGTAALVPARADGNQRHRFIVKPRPGCDILAVAAAHGAQVIKQIPDDDAYVLQKQTADAEATLVALAADPLVFEAQGDGDVSVPEDPASQLAFAFDIGPDPMGYTNQGAFYQVNLGKAHRWATGRGIRVAVLDTGVNVNHPDLVGHCLPGYNAIDPSLPPDDVPAPDSGSGMGIFAQSSSGAGHGTMIAGIIAVIAPQARILPVKVLGPDGIGKESDVVEGIYWAIRHGADVINMSFSAPSSSPAIDRAIKAARTAGIVLVASAGNDATDMPYCPASLKGVLSVTSVEADNTKSLWATFGPTIDLVCPGNGIRSTFWDGGYATWSGTSFAAAFVTGAAALARELEPNGSSNKIAKLLKTTATSVDEVNPDYAGLLGAGLLNIEKAVRKAD